MNQVEEDNNMKADDKLVDKYLISLVNQTSLNSKAKNEVIASLAHLTDAQKAQLKMALLEYLTIDAQAEILSQIDEQKAKNMTYDEMQNLIKKIQNRAIEKEDASVTAIDIQDAKESLTGDKK